MSSTKPLTAIVERLIEQNKKEKPPEKPKRKRRQKSVVFKPDFEIPKKRTLH